MTEITSAGRQLAADLEAAEGPDECWWNAKEALARLATQSIARDAELAEALADLREMDQAKRAAFLLALQFEWNNKERMGL